MQGNSHGVSLGWGLNFDPLSTWTKLTTPSFVRSLFETRKTDENVTGSHRALVLLEVQCEKNLALNSL